MRLTSKTGFALLICSMISSMAQVPTDNKVWTFRLPHGSLRVRAERDVSGSVSLGIAPDGRIQEAPIGEQIQALSKVVHEMAQFGFDPKKLAYIGTHLYAEDATAKLAYACADSSRWRSSVKGGGTDRNQLVVELLNQSGAFQPYNEIFETLGLQVRVTEAEKVGLMPFSRIPARNAGDRANATLPVPADAMIGMRFTRTDSGGVRN